MSNVSACNRPVSLKRKLAEPGLVFAAPLPELLPWQWDVHMQSRAPERCLVRDTWALRRLLNQKHDQKMKGEDMDA